MAEPVLSGRVLHRVLVSPVGAAWCLVVVGLGPLHRQGLRTMGGATFLDTDRQLYTGMFSLDPGWWASSFVYSQAIQQGERTRRLSWWGEYRPSHRSNMGLRIDDPGSWIEGTVYGDYQWFIERAMVWLVFQQKLREGAHVSLAQIKLVF